MNPSPGQLSIDTAHPSSINVRGSTKRILAMYNDPGNVPPPVLVLESHESKHSKSLDLVEKIKVGRITSSKTIAAPGNGYFESKVLSRTHAEIWGENGKAYIKDLGSSNGTFLNGKRLSEENQESLPHEVRTGDRIEFGVDIMSENGEEVLFKKVSVIATLVDPNDKDSINFKRDVSQDFSTVKHEYRSSSKGSGKAADASHLSKAKQANKDINALKSSVAAIQNSVQNVDLNEFENLKRRVTDAENQRDKLQATIEDLERQIKTQASQLAQSNEKNHELQRKLSELSDPSKNPTSNGQKNDAAGGTSKDTVALNKQISTLLKTIATLESEVKVLKAKSKNTGSASGSFLPIIFIFMILFASFAYFIMYMNGLQTLDQFSQTYFGYALNDVMQVVGVNIKSINSKPMNQGL